MRLLAKINFITQIGRHVLDTLEKLGTIILFFIKTIVHCCRPPYFHQVILKQIIDIGFYSLPVVGLTTLFSGMVLALQSYNGFARFSSESAVATVVALSITRELGPVLAGLMVTGRVGSSIAAELGSMKVTDQIDALKILATDPFDYLIAPRVIACTVCLPVLVLIGDIIGILGGFMVGVYKLGFNSSTYLDQTISYLEISDIVSGLIKASVFGFLLGVMGCFHGYNCSRGAQGVGLATTNAVVSGCILILIFNYLLTELFFTS